MVFEVAFETEESRGAEGTSDRAARLAGDAEGRSAWAPIAVEGFVGWDVNRLDREVALCVAAAGKLRRSFLVPSRASLTAPRRPEKIGRSSPSRARSAAGRSVIDA